MGNELQPVPHDRYIIGDDISRYKESLVGQYRTKNEGILQKLKAGVNLNSDEILSLIAEEILLESEELLGTRLLFENEGNLQDATTVTVKRSDLLKAVADIVAKRKELNQRSDVDLNSPAFMIFQKLCFDKMVDALHDLRFDDEMIQLILTGWAKGMEDWGKELKAKLEEI